MQKGRNLVLKRRKKLKKVLNMTLGEKIKYVRKRRKMSQAELAEAVNVYQKNISRYENDSTIPSAITLRNIAKILEVSADFLLSENSEEINLEDGELQEKFIELQRVTGKNKEMAILFLDLLIRDYKTRKAYTDQ
jgi:transcriptional regulator with XRE-family HTH domain